MRLISESEELAQGVKILFVGVLSLLAVDEAFSLYEDVWQQSAEAASRWGPLRAIVCLDRSSWSRP